MIHDRSRLMLADDVISLREISRADTEFIISLRNDPRVLNGFTSGSLISKEVHEAFLDRYFSEENTEEIYLINKAGKSIGMISIYNIAGGSAEWGRIAIVPGCQGEGNGRRALRLIIRRAKELGIILLYCHVKKDNRNAVNLYQSIGFTKKKEIEKEFYLELPLNEAVTDP